MINKSIAVVTRVCTRNGLRLRTAASGTRSYELSIRDVRMIRSFVKNFGDHRSPLRNDC